jgi:N-acetylneuraminic acid mutarotase
MRTRYLLSFRLLVCLPALVLISSYAWAQTPALSEWTWMGGSSTLASSSGSPGVYGTLGTPAAGNIPGGRDNATSWTDPAGNLWLFGGQDVDANGEGVLFNDLWKFNPSTNEWVWMSGRSTVTCSPSSFCGQPGVYGTLDTPAAGNVPGGRWSTSSWIDTSGHLWLYGGYGLDANGVLGFPNDLWEFDPSANLWTWMGGSSTTPVGGEGQAPVYGTQGAFAAGNNPGGRWNAAAWTDSSGHFWLFGGDGYYAIGVPGALNDLWEFDPSINEWAWIGGSNTAGSDCPEGFCLHQAVDGTLGTPASGNNPGSRDKVANWTDSGGHLWLFGGSIPGVLLTYLDDLWEYFPSTNEWAWMGGGSSLDPPGVYGMLGEPAAGNIPGGRCCMANWSDSSGHLWLLGGQGYDANSNQGDLNDLWQYDPSTNQWAWMGGESALPCGGLGCFAPGVYGTLGVPAAGNIPGSRGDDASWTDKNGNFWLFGGDGADANDSLSTLNDLWKYDSSESTPPAAATPTFNPQAGTYDSAQSVTISDAKSGAAIYYTTDGTTPTTSSSVYNSPITVGSTETLEAIATAGGYSASPVAMATYTIESTICTSAPGMNITYLTVAETDQDASRAPSGTSSNYVLPGLGKDGLPVYNPNATATTGGVYAPYDLLSDGEITWWNPVLNNGGPGGTSDVVETGTGTVTLPFADNAFFPPNGTGPNDLNGFQAAILSGTLVAPAAETVSFSVSSDDMAFVYLDGQIACDDGGVHAAAAAPCSTPVIAAGEHTLQLFYIDLHPVGAVLDFSLTTLNVCTNPIQHQITLTWPTPAPITYGTPLSATQLDASSGGVAGAFAYNPAAGTVLPGGTHTLAVAFTPTDTADYTSATATVQLTVNRAPVTVTLTPNPGSITAGNSITFAATVQSTTTGTPTGTVTFFNGTSTLGTANLVNGVATLTASLSTQGTETITASYPGDTDFLPGASNAVSVNVLSASTSTLLTGSPNPAPFGTAVTFSATVSSPGGTPAGSISFFDGATLLGTSTLTSGVATYSTSILAVGSHNITATYPGTAEFDAGTSNVLVEQIADFAVSVLPGSRTLYSGEAASFAVSVTSVSGFNIPVALTCSQLPENTTCNFSAATVTGAGGSSTLTVQTTAPSQITAGSALSGGYRVIALSAIFLIFIPRRWRRHRGGWSLILVIFAILASWIAITGCSASRSLAPGTPVGIDTFTVTGTATNGSQTLAHATSVTLNVKSLF